MANLLLQKDTSQYLTNKQAPLHNGVFTGASEAQRRQAAIEANSDAITKKVLDSMTFDTGPVNGADIRTSGGSGGGGSSYTDTSVARSLIQRQLDALGGLQASQDQAAQAAYDNLINQYNVEDARAQQAYNTQTESNDKALSRGTSTALTSAAQGARGLKGVLASLGALSGTGLDLANRAVAQAANTDLGNVNDNYTTNATNLNTAWGQTQEDQQKRKQQADSSLRDARTKNAADVATKRADLLGQMADKYSTSGMRAQASSTADSIGSLYDTINRGAAISTPSWNPMQAAFNPAALQNYLAGGYNQSVQAQGSAGANLPVNTPLFAQTKRRDQALA